MPSLSVVVGILPKKSPDKTNLREKAFVTRLPVKAVTGEGTDPLKIGEEDGLPVILKLVGAKDVPSAPLIV